MSSSSSMASILLLAISVFSIIFPSLASRQALHHFSDIKRGLQVTLRHIDSGKGFTEFELLQSVAKHSRKRTEALTAKVSGKSIDVPAQYEDGIYLMELSIGTPPLPYSAILDTGSDLIWTQCKQCVKCFNQSTPLYNPYNSSSFSILPCSSSFCSALLPSSSCARGECAYIYGYEDGSTFTEGVLGSETFTFAGVSVPKIAFGCGLLNVGTYLGSGIVGLGRGPLSLVSQLDEPKFSYCFSPFYSQKSSRLLMGSLAAASLKGKSLRPSVLTTPFIKNLRFPSNYYLSLQGITVGGILLPINKSTFAIKGDGSGGMVIDSGTTITALEKSAFDLLAREFARQIRLEVSNRTFFDLCFTLPANTQVVEVPEIVFHFEGADLNLPSENYFAEVVDGVACLFLESSSGLSIFGSFQQQNMVVVYDLAKGRLSFVDTPCD